MKRSLARATLLLGSILSLSSSPVTAQSDVDRVDALNARCEASRQAKLEPIRRQKIARCEAGADKPTAGCAVYYSTYGNNSNHVNGSVVRGLFYDIPECRQAQKATQTMNMRRNF